MAFSFHLKPKARKNLDRLPEKDRIKVVAVLDIIVREPFAGKKLSGKRQGEYSVRVWPYRIIYTIDKNELLVVVVDVDHRGHIRNY